MYVSLLTHYRYWIPVRVTAIFFYQPVFAFIQCYERTVNVLLYCEKGRNLCITCSSQRHVKPYSVLVGGKLKPISRITEIVGYFHYLFKLPLNKPCPQISVCKATASIRSVSRGEA